MNEIRIPHIFELSRRVRRYERALRAQRREGATSWLFDDMIDDVMDRLDFMRLDSGTAAVLGDATGALASALDQRGFDVESMGPGTIDEEAPWVGARRNLIVSLGTLGTLNDLPGALLHARAALDEEGIFMAQMIGAGSLSALRQIVLAADGATPAARLHPQVDNRSAAALLQRAGVKSQVVDSRSLHVRYSSFDRLISDLREQGLTGVLADRPPPISRSGLERSREAFDKLRDADGKVAERFEILALTGWR